MMPSPSCQQLYIAEARLVFVIHRPQSERGGERRGREGRGREGKEKERKNKPVLCVLRQGLIT